MNVSKEDFLQTNHELKNELEALVRNEEGGFIDGALNPLEYYDSKIKILWVLKEAYEDAFSYPDFFTKEFDKFYTKIVCGGPKYTWGTIAKVSYNILNKPILDSSEDVLHINKAKAKETLAKIAFININKDSSNTGAWSDNKNLTEAMTHYKKFLLKQIEHLNPTVIICGNTFQFLKAAFGFPPVIKQVNNVNYVDHYNFDNKLILDPYHPGYLARGKLDSASYINDIVRTVRDCLPLAKSSAI